MMLRYLTSTLAVCALASTASVFGQQAPAPEQKEDAPKATLTGCVVEAKTTDGGTAYILDKAEGGSAGAVYVLIGSSPTEFAPNVNKKVEVTGAVRQPPAAPASEDAAASQKVLRPPAVLVESVKVVAETCK
jgi:hypothetical protein